MKNNYKKIIGALLFLFWTANSALADSIIELGAHFGGDEILDQPYKNGHKESMKAGEQFSFDFGRLKKLSPSWAVQLTFGVKSDAKYDHDMEVSWVRYPLNGLLYHQMDGMRLGAGATIHFAPKLEGGGQASNINEEFHDALGGLLEMDFNYNEKFLWGIRLTLIEYESKKNGRVVDGSSIGFLIIAQL